MSDNHIQNPLDDATLESLKIALSSADKHIQMSAYNEAMYLLKKTGDLRIQVLLQEVFLNENQLLDEKSLAAIKTALSDSDQTVRSRAATEAIESWLKTSDARLLIVLQMTLYDENPDIRWTTAEVLLKHSDALFMVMDSRIIAYFAKLGDRRVIPILRRLIETSMENSLFKGQFLTFVHGDLPPVIDALIKLGDVGLKALADELAPDHPETRIDLLRILAKAKPSQVFELFYAALWDEDGDMQAIAAMALEAYGERGLEALLIAVEDRDARVRIYPALSLGRLGDPRAVPALCDALYHEDVNVHRWAADRLAELGDERAIEPLVMALTYEDTRGYYAQEALIKLKNKQAVTPLLNMLSHQQPYVRSRSAYILGRLGDLRAVEPLMALYCDSNEDVRYSVISALGDLRAESALPIFVNALDDDPNISSSAIGAIAFLDEKGKLALLTALGHSNAEIRKQVVYELGKFKDRGVMDALVDALKDDDSEVRVRAALSLGKLGDERAIQPLISALRDSDAHIRASAATLLGEFADDRAVPALIVLLPDSTPAPFIPVAETAARALEKIGTQKALEAVQNWRKTENS